MADVTISSLPIGTPSGNAVIPFSQDNQTLKTNVSTLTANLVPRNSPGLAKAWVLFNGGSVINGAGDVSIYSSYNVTRVNRSQAGVYAIYLTNPLASANCIVSGSVPNTGQFVSGGVYSGGRISSSIVNVSTGMSSSNLTDMDLTSVIIFGN